MNEMQATGLLKSLVHRCIVIELDNGCTLETVPKALMDVARKSFGVAETAPVKLSEVFADQGPPVTSDTEKA